MAGTPQAETLAPWQRGNPFRPDAPDAPATSKLDLSMLTVPIGRNKPLVIAITLAFVALGLVYVSITPRTYTALAQLLIDPRGLQVVRDDIAGRSNAGEGAASEADSQVSVISSASTLDNVITSLRLDEDPLFGARQQGFIGRMLGNPVIEPRMRARRVLERALTVRRLERSFVFTIGISSSDPVRAAAVANAIATTYLENEITSRAELTRRASGALVDRLDEMRRRVETAERDLEEYKARNNLIGAGGRLVSDQQLAELNTQLINARVRTVEARTRFERITDAQRRRVQPDFIPEALQLGSIAALRGRFADVKRQEAELLQSLGPRHPSVLSAQSQAAELQRQIDQEIARVAQGAETELRRAEAAQGMLEQTLDSLKRSVVDSSSAQVRQRELEREFEAARVVYQTFLLRANELREQISVDTTNARIITRAVAPLEPSDPPPALIVVAAALVGFAFGAGAAFVREQIRPSAPPPPAGGGAPLPRPAPAPAPAGPAFATAPTARNDLSWDAPAAAPPPAAPHPAKGGIESLTPLPVLARLSAGELANGTPADSLVAAMAGLGAAPADRARVVLIVAPIAGETGAKVAFDAARIAARTARVLLVDVDDEGRRLSTRFPAERGGLQDVLGGGPLVGSLVRQDGSSLAILPLGPGRWRWTRRA